MMKAVDNLKLKVQRIVMPFQWLFVRLPRAFSIPLVIVAFLYFFLVFPLLVNFANLMIIGRPLKFIGIDLRVFSVGHYVTQIWQHGLGWPAFVLVLLGLAAVVALILSALITLLLAFLGILFSYWLAGQIYMYYRRWTIQPLESPPPVPPRYGANTNSSNNPLAGFNRIGIILSGGGAKGAYQAGAMQAIYEFLEQHDAHRKVQMIAATSIGSWNALFWLADLMKSHNGGMSPLEQWWSQVAMEKIILPVTYLPTQQNYLLSNQPWREDFDALFKGTPAGERLVERANDDGLLRFYFTHCNIGKATLAFSTNRRSWDDVTANLPTRRARPVVTTGSYRRVAHDDEKLTLDNMRRDVFCSMDIPPLFPYTSIDDDFFEDGGVIDNLPIRFGTEVEECDLLFILPLNASFERKVDQRSLIRRLARVTEIRQGVLERNSFKMIYLYNELASLREQLTELKEQIHAAPTEHRAEGGELKALSGKKLADRALARTHNVVHVFSICPAPELMLNTTEFWKTKEAGKAFRFMREVTRNELKRFTHLVSSNQIRMALVSPVAPARSNNGNGMSDLIPDTASYFDNAQPIYKSAGLVDYQVTYFKDF